MNNIDRTLIENIVINVQKPARYIGGELNTVIKKHSIIRAAISYPDLYEIGMSNNGIRILYDIANSIDDIACERVFAVEKDFEALLRQEKIPLYTLETFTPLHQLDLLGFNLSHELLFTNMLQILDLGEVPLLSSDRTEEHPLVLAGGAAVSNPFPVMDFIDVFFAGDGEEAFPEILEIIKQGKQQALKRDQIMDLLSEVDGVLIPSKYTLTYSNGEFNNIEGKIIKKRVYRNKKSHNPEKPIVPNIRITQERAVYEITKGCRNLCKFCHAGYYDLPYRCFDVEDAYSEIFAIIDNTGYSELSFLSLSISDFKNLPWLINSVLPELSRRGISVSLPSLKVDKATLPVIETISDIRKTSLTFAVESASDEIREIAYKRVNTDDLLSIVEEVFNKGWRLIKLYFMIGLPGCEDHDEASAIVSLLKKIINVPGRKREINVTISPFVPKPHTPFEREKQMDGEYFYEIITRIKKGLPSAVKIKNHDLKSSMLEGVFARGDSRLGKAILKAYMNGCRFDSWKEHFDFYKWKQSLDETVPEWKKFLDRRDLNAKLPWSVVKTGYDNVKLLMKEKSLDLNNNSSKKRFSEELNLVEIKKGTEDFKRKYEFKTRVRMKLSKTGPAEFIPHIDFIEVIKRALRMSGVPVTFTRGFNKREKISMGFPLPLGIGSQCEFCDIDLYDDLPEGFIETMNRKFPQGIRVMEARYFNGKESIMAITAAADYSVDIPDMKIIEIISGNLKNKISFIKRGKRKEVTCSFDDAVESYDIIDEDKLNIRLFTGTGSSVRIDSVLSTLAEEENAPIFFKVVKICQYRRVGEGLVPIE